MPRPPRADEAGGIYHALNRGNARQTVFHDDGDVEAFESVVAEALGQYPVELFAYQRERRGKAETLYLSS